MSIMSCADTTSAEPRCTVGISSMTAPESLWWTSLTDPKTPHPNAHTEQELKWIKDYHRRNPNISSICKLYGKLREDKAYSRHPGSLYRVFVRLGFRKKPESTKKKSLHLGKYDTPTKIGEKCQTDVKYVLTVCYAGSYGEKFFQYSMIDEATRERFIYAYKEQSGFSTVDFGNSTYTAQTVFQWRF